MILGRSVSIKIDAYIDDGQLEKRDFYTEYEFINKFNSINDKSDNDNDNVLNYLQDNKNIDLIDKNKFQQSICHWSLCDNNNYIFNVYNGFSGLINYNGKVFENNHQYYNTPNLVLKEFNPAQNTIGWVNCVEIRDWKQFYNEYIRNINRNKNKAVFIDGHSNFINNVKYDYSEYEITPFYLLGVKCLNTSVFNRIIERFSASRISLDPSNKLYLIILDTNMLMLVTTDYNYLSFGKFKDYINAVTNENEYFNCLKNLIKSVIYPDVIKFNRSLEIHAISDDNCILSNVQENKYYKKDNINDYVVRYSGKIKPTFTNINSTLYYKDMINYNDIESSVYKKYAYLGDPLYPSIDYCAIKKIVNYNRNTLPTVPFISNNSEVKVNIYEPSYEYKWFDNSKCIVLVPIITDSYTIDTKTINDNILLETVVDEKITETISKVYNITDTNLILYIKSLYTCINNLEYASLYNTDEYIYNLTLTLK
jgi:hypothetical protein